MQLEFPFVLKEVKKPTKPKDYSVGFPVKEAGLRREDLQVLSYYPSIQMEMRVNHLHVDTLKVGDMVSVLDNATVVPISDERCRGRQIIGVVIGVRNSFEEGTIATIQTNRALYTVALRVTRSYICATGNPILAIVYDYFGNEPYSFYEQLQIESSPNPLSDTINIIIRSEIAHPKLYQIAEGQEIPIARTFTIASLRGR